MLTALTSAAPSPPSPWGALLAAYFTLIGLPSGLTLMTWWHRHRWPAASLTVDWRATWVCLVLLTGASVLLTVDLGRPERFFLMLSRFGNWDSPISLGAKIIAVKTFLLGVALYMLWRRRAASAQLPAVARGLTAYLDTGVAWSLGLASIALGVYPAAVLARTWVAPLGGTSGSALIFLVTSLLMGAAAIQLIYALTSESTAAHRALQVRVTLVLLMGYAAVLVFAAVSIGNGPAADALDAILTGAWAPLFYGAALGAGLLIPVLVLVLATDRRWAQVVGAAGVLAGACAIRFLIFAA